MIGLYQSLQYTLNKCFPAFPRLWRCFCHVQNRNTHSYKIGRLWLSMTVHTLSEYPFNICLIWWIHPYNIHYSIWLMNSLIIEYSIPVWQLGLICFLNIGSDYKWTHSTSHFIAYTSRISIVHPYPSTVHWIW